MENMAVEEEDGAEGLGLGGGRNLPLICKVSDELGDFGNAHFPWVAFVVMEDVGANP